MKFRQYLESVLGSKVKISIARAMFKFPDKIFTARELAGFVNVSHTPVLISLKDLEGMNLIEVEEHGTSKLIRLNKRSYLYDPLKNLFNYEDNTKNKLVSKIKGIVSNAEMVVLFGSIEKGSERMNSDIDILVVTKYKKRTREDLEANQNSIIETFGNPISPIILTKNQFINKKNKPFAKDLAKKYKVIEGKDLIKRYWK